MNGKLNNTLIATLKPGPAPFEVNDTDLKGFGLRVQPSGVMSFFVRYRLRGKQSRFVIGRTSEFTAAQARDTARSTLAGVNLGGNPIEGRKAVESPKTLGRYMDDDYEPWVKANRKSGAATVARLRVNFAEFWNKPLCDLNSWSVEKWRRQRLTNPKKPAKPATVNRDLASIKAALGRAVEWGFLPSHPLANVKQARIDIASVVRYLRPAERESLIGALSAREIAVRASRASANEWRRARNYPEMPTLEDQTFVDHLKPAVIISLNTGLRRGELLSLAWTDVDETSRQLTVKGGNAKSGKTRHIPLNSEAWTALTQWRQQSSEAHGLVFPAASGRRMVDVKTAWAGVVESAKVQDFRWHDMRHDFASQLVMAGVDLNTVRELLGHADLTMTIRYAHLAPAHKAAAVEKLVRA